MKIGVIVTICDVFQPLEKLFPTFLRFDLLEQSIVYLQVTGYMCRPVGISSFEYFIEARSVKIIQ